MSAPTQMSEKVSSLLAFILPYTRWLELAMFERQTRRRSVVVAGLILIIYLLTRVSKDHSAHPRIINSYDAPKLLTKRPSFFSRDDAYRRRLATVRPNDSFSHSKTLGTVDAIYVINLARRPDRRKLMDLLAQALDLEFTYVNATDFATPGEGMELMEKLMDRVRWQRNRIDEEDDIALEDWPFPNEHSSSTHVLDAFPFKWSKDAIDNANDSLAQPLGISGADYWDLDPPDTRWENAHPLPDITEEEKTAKIQTASRTNNMFKNSPLTRPMMARWHSHVRVMRDIVRRQLHAALILEDKADMEWDVERALRSIWDALPQDWDIIYLGHCWSEEYKGTPIPTAYRLRSSVHTLCTYGYGVSLRGATKILRFLRSPDYAFSRPIDHGLKDLAQMHLINSYSVYPPLIMEIQVDVNDVLAGSDLRWKPDSMVDSTLERISLVNAASRPPRDEWEEYEPY